MNYEGKRSQFNIINIIMNDTRSDKIAENIVNHSFAYKPQ